MKKLLIASGNPAKIEMYKEIFKEVEGVDLKFLSDFNKVESPEENEPTVEENALLKAKYYFEKFGIPCLGDDSGLGIDDLNGEPGVKARRWAGELPDSVSDEDWSEYYKKKVNGLNEVFDAHFFYSRCLYLGENDYHFANHKRYFKMSKTQQREIMPGWPASAFMVDENGNDVKDNNTRKPESIIKLINDNLLGK